VSKSMPAEQTVEFFLQLTSNHDRRDCTWNETLVRFHLPATALMKYLVITTGDTVDSGTSCAISQAQKGDNRGVGEPSLLFETGQELLQVVVVRQRLAFG
jgi:hypothetical protein